MLSGTRRINSLDPDNTLTATGYLTKILFSTINGDMLAQEANVPRQVDVMDGMYLKEVSISMNK